MLALPPTGTNQTRLIILRGNSGSGKSTVARAVRSRHGRGCALIEQDYLRRIVLRERDVDGGIAPRTDRTDGPLRPRPRLPRRARRHPRALPLRRDADRAVPGPPRADHSLAETVELVASELDGVPPATRILG